MNNPPPSSTQSQALSELLSIARVINGDKIEAEAMCTMLEQYVDMFEKLIPSLVIEQLDDSGRQNLTELGVLHPKVLAMAQALQDKTTIELKGIKRKGKGILAYIDTLPKQVSIRAPKKG